ncbi:hypothetical protein N7475_005359 [Penicillium sp. IBT 31633x]|nr:hypothetical protein N7475_005359 [Penicillium sp. IBT 31633x]
MAKDMHLPPCLPPPQQCWLSGFRHSITSLSFPRLYAVLSWIFEHLKFFDTNPSRELRLDSIDQTLKQDAHTTREREFRKKLMHALKLSVRKSPEPTNSEKTCLCYTCPEPHEVRVSYYYRHHSGSLINYKINPAEPIYPLDGALNIEISLQVRDQITKGCSYKPDDIKRLSWFAAQDMQCFLKLLPRSNELVQDKVSHKGHERALNNQHRDPLLKIVSWPPLDNPSVSTRILERR